MPCHYYGDFANVARFALYSLGQALLLIGIDQHCLFHPPRITTTAFFISTPMLEIFSMRNALCYTLLFHSQLTYAVIVLPLNLL